jgi:hypothetical protein
LYYDTFQRKERLTIHGCNTIHKNSHKRANLRVNRKSLFYFYERV